ncbi:MAG: biopolymer transporter ExbD [Dysgonamonadaceae bacterium]|jgi:biopolymer transport protein ExbD|nr:biopolymer transporter ExbD [Dysgonamonadaceae bacterium]
MAEVQTGGHEKGGKNKQKKISLRVDFTPMVDMNMLLITFFMFCTSLSKPQTMEFSMPDKDAKVEDQTKVPPERAITILLAKDNKVYYYFGEPNYEDYTSLIESDYTANGLRKMLLGRNADMIAKLDALKQRKKNNQISEEDFEIQAAEAKKAKEAPVIVIKPMDDASYNNMVDALDEMLVCNITKYAIVEFSDVDDFLLKNYLTQGKAAEAAPN